MINLPLTPAEHRDIYVHLASSRAKDYPTIKSVIDKLKKLEAHVFCCNCGEESVYAKGRCEPCYRFQKRNGGERPFQR